MKIEEQIIDQLRKEGVDFSYINVKHDSAYGPGYRMAKTHEERMRIFRRALSEYKHLCKKRSFTVRPPDEKHY